jgi:hypothetical protein
VAHAGHAADARTHLKEPWLIAKALRRNPIREFAHHVGQGYHSECVSPGDAEREMFYDEGIEKPLDGLAGDRFRVAVRKIAG